MDAFPLPVRDLDKPFMMHIEDSFTITGRGTVVSGKVETGSLSTGDYVDIVGIQDPVWRALFYRPLCDN